MITSSFTMFTVSSYQYWQIFPTIKEKEISINYLIKRKWHVVVISNLFIN